ncbi:MAG: hypothetical protein Q9174_007496 [Haloplaca sp. 1 TL-2023]
MIAYISSMKPPEWEVEDSELNACLTESIQAIDQQFKTYLRHPEKANITDIEDKDFESNASADGVGPKPLYNELEDTLMMDAMVKSTGIFTTKRSLHGSYRLEESQAADRARTAYGMGP